MSGTSSSEEGTRTVEEGRYLYCVVRVPDEADGTFAVDGVGGTTTKLVTAGDIGAVVHPCESLYDSEDPAQVRRWLLRHQAVVDDAGERFGTPLPVRFDTVIRGGDEGVREWLREERETLASALERFAGHWEYRITVRWDEERLDEAVDGDERLAELRSRREEATEGTGFLVGKQYEKRLAQLKRAYREERSAALEDALADVARESRDLGRPGAALSALSGTGEGNDGDGTAAADAADDDGPRTRLAVLAPTEAEDRIGRVLEELADDPAASVRFTGPWPPYTFAPELSTDE